MPEQSVGSRNDPRIPTIPSLACSADRFIARQKHHCAPRRVECEQDPNLASAGRGCPEFLYVLERRPSHGIHKRPFGTRPTTLEHLQRIPDAGSRLTVQFIQPWLYQTQVDFPAPHNIPHKLYRVQCRSSLPISMVAMPSNTDMAGCWRKPTSILRESNGNFAGTPRTSCSDQAQTKQIDRMLSNTIRIRLRICPN